MSRLEDRSWSWAEVKEYWQTHQRDRSNVDLTKDPDGLDNVCFTGAPSWLNEFYAAEQREVFARLAPSPPVPGVSRALDVGCGAGRWARELQQSGYAVTGVDLQSDLISAARARTPEIDFREQAVQTMAESAVFDLVSSVTVLQHLPPVEQRRAVEAISQVAKPVSRVLILENTRDEGLHVFARSERDWIALFAEQGYRLVQRRRYDYNPMLHLIDRARVILRRPNPASRSPAGAGQPGAAPTNRKVRAPIVKAQRIAMRMDLVLGRMVAAFQPRAGARHCALLFERTPDSENRPT